MRYHVYIPTNALLLEIPHFRGVTPEIVNFVMRKTMRSQYFLLGSSTRKHIRQFVRLLLTLLLTTGS